jgi:glycosyltransferase involved in cell wall biosynthesis/SAM-dependent methyltransferase
MSQYSNSIALIVKNEESCLDKCLSSFAPIADEIVVVDTGSTDRTKEIARKYTDKIYDFKWVDDFSAARNFSFSKCTCDWIYWIDADDFLPPSEAQKIRAFDLSDKEIIICNYEYCLDECGASLMTVPRERWLKKEVFLRGSHWEEKIHEYFPINNAKIYISDISHFHYKKAGSSERNLKILERIVKKPGCISRNLYYYGRELADIGRIDEAISFLNKFINAGDGFWEDVYAAHYRLAEIYFSRDETKFKEHLFKSIAIEERRAEPFYLMAQYWESKQQWLRAAQWYEFCTAVKRPKDLLASYQPGLYTWQPALQLTVNFNNAGDLQKAYEWNEKALSYRPQDPRMINNKTILLNGIRERKIQARKDGLGKKLNLGAGGKREEGFVSVDLFVGPNIDEVFDLDEIPYLDNTIGAINSEHSLEHVGWVRVDKALSEWWRVLKPGGFLMLKMPDAEDCFKKYLETDPNNKPHRDWYKFTVWGVQRSQAGEPDEGQYHRSGFSQRELNDKLEALGFILDFSVKYNGFDTWSFATRAIKPICPTKVAWLAPQNWEAAQTRIRVLHMNRWLRSKGYISYVTENYQEIIDKNYDVCIVGKSFDEGHYNNIKYLKGQGKIVICDLCEELTGFPYVNEILSLCDLVVCCSTELARIVQEKTGRPVQVIEDAFEG